MADCSEISFKFSRALCYIYNYDLILKLISIILSLDGERVQSNFVAATKLLCTLSPSSERII